MQIPLRIVAHGLELGPTEQESIRAHAEKLETFFGRALTCRVTVSAPNRWPQAGPILYQVRIDLTVPGEELVIERQPNENLLDAIQDAFRVAGRRLQDYAGRLASTSPPEAQVRPGRARVSRLFPWEGYGFLQTPDGREIYFHRNSVLLGGFDRLEVGTEVRYAEEEGEKGPQASSVSVAGGHRAGRQLSAGEPES
ncbi:MAG TPA: HPF/RaiA family ribosome-associated protein [Gemmatimonadales bacterium]|jgi:cold shock CspA family protein/ribosome-associated translation inhibitor RaiA